jgi:hypothetical protein
MDENKSKRTDLDIASEFDRLFNQVPEPVTDAEIKTFLEETGYDVEKLKADGAAFINDLIASNWRFANLRDMRDAAAKINEVPVRKGWNHHRLTEAIEKVSAALRTVGTQPNLAFRNLDELTDTDLAIILQELEYTARSSGISVDLDS